MQQDAQDELTDADGTPHGADVDAEVWRLKPNKSAFSWTVFNSSLKWVYIIFVLTHTVGIIADPIMIQYFMWSQTVRR